MVPSSVRTLFFASYGELLGLEELAVPVEAPVPVAAFIREIRGRGEPFDRLPADPAVAVNREVASGDTLIRPGDEVAFLPPVAGG